MPRILGYFDELSGTDLNPDVLAVFRAMLENQGIKPVPAEEGSEPELEEAGAPVGADERPTGRSAEAGAGDGADVGDVADSGGSGDSEGSGDS